MWIHSLKLNIIQESFLAMTNQHNASNNKRKSKDIEKTPSKPLSSSFFMRNENVLSLSLVITDTITAIFS